MQEPHPIRKNYRFTEDDAALIKRLARYHGDVSERALLSRLIREEARRVGLRLEDTNETGQNG